MGSQAHKTCSAFKGPITSLEDWDNHKEKLRISNFSAFFPANGKVEDYHRFLADAGLLLRKDYSYDCPNCGPGQKLSPCRDINSKFHFHLKCVAGPLHCGKKVQPTWLTWFEKAHVTLHQNIGIILYFALDIPVTDAARNFDVTEKTAVDMYSMLREACAISLLDDLKTQKIGGPGRVVEIDEAKLSKHKYHRGRKTARQDIWCLGGVERETRRSFAVLVKKRNRRTLFPLIEHFVERGTTILTDEWKAYKTIGQTIGGHHTAINHSRYYVHPRNDKIHTNTVERRWRTMRKLIKCHRESVLELHMLMAVYRSTNLMLPFNEHTPKTKRTIRSCGEALDIVLASIKRVYPGMVGDALRPPLRVQVPVGSHPFPGKSSLIIESEDEGAMPNNSSDNCSSEESDSGSTVTPVINSPAAASLHSSSSANINSMDWDEIEELAIKILREIVNSPGVFHDRWLLHDAVLSTHGEVIEAILVKVRLEPLKMYNDALSRDIYHPIDAEIPSGVKKGMRPLTTEAGGDCFYSTLSWSVHKVPHYCAVHRLLCLRVVVMYFQSFDTQGMRYEIQQHHGPSGALSLALSIAALGSAGLDNILEQNYTAYIVPNFNFASSACLLAASVVMKARIYVYEALDESSIGPISTLQQLQQEFENDRTRIPSMQRFGNCARYTAGRDYIKVHRVYHQNQHFVQMMRTQHLTPAMLIPAVRHDLINLPLTAVDF